MLQYKAISSHQYRQWCVPFQFWVLVFPPWCPWLRSCTGVQNNPLAKDIFHLKWLFVMQIYIMYLQELKVGTMCPTLIWFLFWWTFLVILVVTYKFVTLIVKSKWVQVWVFFCVLTHVWQYYDSLLTLIEVVIRYSIPSLSLFSLRFQVC